MECYFVRTEYYSVWTAYLIVPTEYIFLNENIECPKGTTVEIQWYNGIDMNVSSPVV